MVPGSVKVLRHELIHLIGEFFLLLCIAIPILERTINAFFTRGQFQVFLLIREKFLGNIQPEIFRI